MKVLVIDMNRSHRILCG